MAFLHPIVLIGKGTTKIGDPSGKDSARPVLSSENIEKNQNNIRTIFEKFLKTKPIDAGVNTVLKTNP